MSLIYQANQQQFFTKTDRSGRYTFESLEPGRYDIRVEHPLFQAQEQKGILVGIGFAQSINFELQPSERGPTRVVPAPIWNVWTETPTSSAKFQPVKPHTNRPYSVVVDLAALSLKEFNDSVVSKISSNSFSRFLKENADQDPVDVDILLLPDPKYFLLSPNMRKPLHIDLKKIRTAQSPGISLPEGKPFQFLRDRNGNAEFNFGSQVFDLQTKSTSGWAGISVSVWADGKPVDEISVHVCLVDNQHSDCGPLNEPVSTLEGIDLSSNNRRPDAALHLIDQQTQIIGVYRCNVCGWDESDFRVWHIEKSGTWLRDRVSEVLQQMTQDPDPRSQATITSNFESAGDNLFNAIFHSSETDAKTAANSLSQLANKTYNQGPSLHAIPTFFVRLIQTQPELVLAPMALVRVEMPDHSREFIGNRLIVESPLQYQDYSRQTTCLSDWILFVPPNSNDAALRDVEHARNAFASEINSFRTACPNCVIEKEKDFEDWLRGRSPQKANSVLILSHHDPEHNKLFFYKGGSPAIQSLAITRSFVTPSLAIINACGTAQSGATEFVSEFNSQGVVSVIATSTEVEPEMAGKFLSVLVDLLRSNQATRNYTISTARFEAVRKLSAMPDPNGTPYGARALAFVLVGNGALTLCVPPKADSN